MSYEKKNWKGIEVLSGIGQNNIVLDGIGPKNQVLSGISINNEEKYTENLASVYLSSYLSIF